MIYRLPSYLYLPYSISLIYFRPLSTSFPQHLFFCLSSFLPYPPFCASFLALLLPLFTIPPVLSSLPSFLCSLPLLPSSLLLSLCYPPIFPSFLPSFLYFLLSFLTSFLPSFLPTFLVFLHFFDLLFWLLSVLPSFIPSFLPCFCSFLF